MRTKFGFVLALCLAGIAVQAIEGLQITVQYPNAVLSWPSVVGETYQVFYRPTLNPDTPWVSLASGLPAAAGANSTTFMHSGIVVIPMDTGSGGGGGVPPVPQIMSATEIGVTASEPNKKPHKKASVDLPPVPWDPVELAKSLQISTDTTLLAAATQSAPQPLGITGFYQVVREEPGSITFPDGWPLAGDAMYIGAQTTHTNGSWVMDIYGQEDYLTSFEGPVDADGYCNMAGQPGPGFSLYLLDQNGEQFPFQYYIVVVETFPPGGGVTAMANASGPATTVITNYVEKSWWGSTRFAVAYQEIFPGNSSDGQYIFNFMSAVAAIAEYRYPNDPIRGSMFLPFALRGPEDWAQMGTDLTDLTVRNLYYFGHGSNDSFGLADRQYQISVADLNGWLHNAFNPLQGLNRHPYRFVFLDGCSSAKGNLSPAFGIPKGRVALGEFTTKRGLRPRAFMGWDKDMLIGWGAVNQGHLGFVERFFDKWAHHVEPEGLPCSLNLAKDLASKNDVGEVSWSDVSHLVVHGYDGLFFQE